MNKIRDAFESIHADTQLKETTKQFLAEKYEKKQRVVFRPAFKGAMAVICVLLVLLAGVGGYSWIQAPAAYMSIDINPSIELVLNRFDKVISATAYNAEGEEILEALSLKGKKYTAAIDAIMESGCMKGYLTEESELVFTIAADSDKGNELKAGVEYCSGHMGHASESIYVDKEIVSEAHDNGCSLGKYYAYLQLSQYDDSVTIDDCRDMSMSKIHDLIKSHTHGDGFSQKECGQTGGGGQETECGQIGDDEQETECRQVEEQNREAESVNPEETDWPDGNMQRRHRNHHGYSAH
ncbi:hypothetical protein AALA00_06995 [Lachnospiraceae bacterium 46-15]